MNMFHDATTYGLLVFTDTRVSESGISASFFRNQIFTSVPLPPPEVLYSCAENCKLYTPACEKVMLVGVESEIPELYNTESKVMIVGVFTSVAT